MSSREVSELEFLTLKRRCERLTEERDGARAMLHHRERQICNTIMGMIDEPEAHDQLEGLTGFTFTQSSLEWMWRILHETEQGNDDDIPGLPPVDEQELWRRVWALAKRFCFHEVQQNAQGLARQRDDAMRALESLAEFTNVMHTWERKPETKLSEVATWIIQSIQTETRKKNEALAAVTRKVSHDDGCALVQSGDAACNCAEVGRELRREAEKQKELAEQLRLVLRVAMRQHGAADVTKNFLRLELKGSHDLPPEEWSAYRMRVQRDEALKKLHAVNASIIQQLRVCAEVAALQLVLTTVYFPDAITNTDDELVWQNAILAWESEKFAIKMVSVALLRHAQRLEEHGVVNG